MNGGTEWWQLHNFYLVEILESLSYLNKECVCGANVTGNWLEAATKYTFHSECILL